MKKRMCMLLFAIGMLLALCVSANAADVGDETALRTAIEKGESVKLTTDITLTAPLTVEKSMTLDLNGKKLIYTGTAGSIITVKSGAELTIADSAAEAGQYGLITSDGTATSANGGGLYIDGGATVVLQGGTLRDCKATEKGGGAYVAVGGELRLTGGVISSGTAKMGGGVYIDDGGTVEMTGGALSGCLANGNDSGGGGAYIANGGTFRMSGGAISRCRSVGNGASGGGMYIELGGIATMSDGTITDCDVTGSGTGEANGGGVYLESPTSSLDPTIPYGFQMSGGSIFRCKAENRGDTGTAYGGGVYIGGWNGSVFEMTGGSIENCKVIGSYKACGGGVYLDGTMNRFTMTGGQITGCTTECNDIASEAYGGGVYVKENNEFEMTGGSIDASCTSYRDLKKDNGGLYLGMMSTMLAHGGTVSCSVMSKEGSIARTDADLSHITTFYSTFINEDGTIKTGVFHGRIERGESAMGGTIEGGTFHGRVDNWRGLIKGGEFFETVDSCGDGTMGFTDGGAISGGVFHGSVLGSRIISGGTFDEKPQYAFIVKFIPRNGGSLPDQVRLNAPAAAPDPAPTKGDQKFLGWYTDSECMQLHDFGNWITADTTLYALWDGDRCTMTFDSAGGSKVEPQRALISGEKAAEPVDPTKDGAAFLGWFTESGKHWNFTHDVVTGSITLTARWAGGSVTPPPTTVPVTGVTLDKSSLTLAKGESAALSAVVKPEDATKKDEDWSSTDASVAAVSDGGTVTAVKAGMALIIVRTADGNYIAVCTVTVTEETPAEYRTVRFDANGGSGSMADVAVQKGSSYQLPACGFTAPEGLEFDAWEIGGARYGVGALYPVQSDTTVKALWKSSAAAPGTCTVRFDANGGSGSMADVSVQKGSSYQLPACGFTALEGTEFDAWEIGGARYGVGALYPVQSDTTVKALWKSSAVTPGTCTIRFDANGGSGSMADMSVRKGSGYTLPACSFTAPEGKQFKGWALSAGGAVLTGSTINVTADITLYAIWEDTPAAEFTITFDANGGTSAVGSMTTAGQKLPSLPGAVRGGYRFDGWYTESSGGTRITAQTVFSGNTTVYAHWTYMNSGGSGSSGGSGGTPGSENRTGRDSTFSDVPTGSYYEEAVSWAAVNGVTAGTDAAQFSPDSVCTRAQAVTFLWRAVGSPAPETRTMPFSDVPAGSYYYGAVLWAVENGITKGTGEAAFSPDDTCTRAQIVSFLYRMIQSEGGGFTGLWMFRLPFTDTPDWAYEAIAWCYQKGITAGTAATIFSPGAPCTRAQIVTFLWRCRLQRSAA